MKATIAELLARIPGPPTSRWPQGEPFARAFHRGTMSVELYAPRGTDDQTPHQQDEIYVVISGRGEFLNGSTRQAFAPGDVLLVPAGVEHRFERFTNDFAAWAVFYGPTGGEKIEPS